MPLSAKALSQLNYSATRPRPNPEHLSTAPTLPPPTTDIRPLFNQQKYSDLTIELGDSSHRYVHKAILSNANEYFAKLCDPDSGFAEANKSRIKLQDDDPTALDTVLRGIYNLPLEPGPDNATRWRFWLSFYITADKYLAAGTRQKAMVMFLGRATACKNIDDICEILETIQRDMAHDKDLTTFVTELREKNLERLLNCQRFRDTLKAGGNKALWEQIDELKLIAFPNLKWA